MNKEELKEITKITKEERGKRLVMWSGVTFFMILIIFLWFLNTKKIFSTIGDTNNNNLDISKASEEFSKTFEELKERMDIMSQQLMATTSQENEQAEEIIKKDKVNGEAREGGLGHEDINKESIEALRDKLEASSTDNIYYEKE